MKRILFIGAEVTGTDTVWGGSRATSHNFIESMKLSSRYSVIHVDRGKIRKEADIATVLQGHDYDLVHVDDTRVLQLFFKAGYRPDVIGPIARAPNGVKVYGDPATPWQSIYTADWFYDGVLIRLNANEERASEYKNRYVTISQGVDTEQLSPVPGKLAQARLVLWAGDAKRPAKNYELFEEVMRITKLPLPFEFKVMSGYQVKDYWATLDEAALLVNTSKYESFCAALFEAKSKGVPTIYRKGLHNDRFEDGRIQVDYTPEGYRDAILSLLSSPGDLLREGSASREYAVEQASFHVMKDSYESAYDLAIATPRARPVLNSPAPVPPLEKPTAPLAAEPAPIPATSVSTPSKAAADHPIPKPIKPLYRRVIFRIGKASVRRAVRWKPSLAHKAAKFVMALTEPKKPKVSKNKKPAKKAAVPVKVSRPAVAGTLHNLLRLPPSVQNVVLAGMMSDKLISEVNLYRHLTALLRAGALDAVREIAAEAFMSKRLRTYFFMRASHAVSYLPMSRNEIEELYEATRGGYLARPANNALAEQVVRMRDPELIQWLARILPDEDLKVLPLPSSAGMIRQLIEANKLEAASELLIRRTADIPAETAYYFLELRHKLNLVEPEGWRPTLDSFERDITHPDETTASAFLAQVSDKMRMIPQGDRDLMDIRFDVEQRERLVSIISTALERKQPLSLIRLGDGEAYAYDPPTTVLAAGQDFSDDAALRERRWWNAQLPPDLSARIRTQVREATSNADIIGFPSIYRVARDRGQPGSRWGMSTGQRGLLTLAHQLGSQVPTDKAIFTEERCHQVVLLKEQLEEWAKLANRVVVVGCWDKMDVFGQNTRWIKVTSQAKLFKATNADTGATLPYTYENTISELADVQAGDLVLVAAGIIGKIFVHEAKKRGAVALDIGSVLDYLAGYQTRSIADII